MFEQFPTGPIENEVEKESSDNEVLISTVEEAKEEKERIEQTIANLTSDSGPVDMIQITQLKKIVLMLDKFIKENDPENESSDDLDEDPSMEGREAA